MACQIVASVTDDFKGVIYDCNTLIVQATGCISTVTHGSMEAWQHRSMGVWEHGKMGAVWLERCSGQDFEAYFNGGWVGDF
jgi:hypothetical protein